MLSLFFLGYSFVVRYNYITILLPGYSCFEALYKFNVGPFTPYVEIICQLLQELPPRLLTPSPTAVLVGALSAFTQPLIPATVQRSVHLYCTLATLYGCALQFHVRLVINCV